MAAVLSPAKDDLAQVARAEEALSRLARHAVRNAPDRRLVLASDFCAAPAIPKVDPTMRPVCSNNEQSSFRKSISSRAATQILLPMLLMAGLGVAATLGWQWYGNSTQEMVPSLSPQPTESSAQSGDANPPIGPAFAAQAGGPAVPAADGEAAQQSSTAAQTASDAIVSAPVTTPSEVSEQLQTMARDLATLQQRIEQLNAGQEQMRRTIARLQASERDIQRRKISSQIFIPTSKPLPTFAAPQTQQLPSTPTPETLPPPPRPPEAMR